MRNNEKKRFFSIFIVSILLFSFLTITGLLTSSDAWAAGLKKVVAVSRFDDRTSWTGQWHLDDGMADQLTDALVQSGQFVVLERQTLSDVTGEQDLVASGLTRKSQTAKTAKLTAAQILIKGTITEFDLKSGGNGSGIGFMGINVSRNKAEAHIGLNIRLIDTTTGEVLDSHRVEGKAKSGGFKIGVNIYGVDFGTGAFKKTPLGKATQIAIDNAVKFIAAKLKNIPFQGQIVRAKAEKIFLTAGLRTGASVGDVFSVYAVDEELIDPDTGESLGAEEELIGTVEIIQVKEKYSKAKILSGKGFIRGDIIRL